MDLQFELYQPIPGQWKWLVRFTPNGKVLARSEQCWSHPGNCHREIIQLKNGVHAAGTIQQEPAEA